MMARRALRCAVVTALIATGSLTSASVLARDLPEARLQAIVDAAAGDAPGIVVRVETRDGSVWSHAAGLAAVGSARAMGDGDAFRIYSVSKMAVAATALALVDEGAMDLDDAIARWLPAGLVATIPNAPQNTVRHLVAQTSGARDYFDDDFVDMIRADFGRHWQPAELVALAVRGAPDAAPGSAVSHYSNTNYVLLGMIIEAVAGRPLAETMRRRVLDPLGMGATHAWEEQPRPASVSGYIRDGGDLVDVSGVDLSVSWAAGGLVSTAADLVRLTRGLFEGDLLSSRSHALMTTDFRPLAGKPVEYGYGTFLFRPLAPPPIGHCGEGPGFGVLTAWWPQTGTVVAVLTNVQGEVHFDVLAALAAALGE
jgi:D-alanyl-D-alanine carboxypeptidase